MRGITLFVLSALLSGCYNPDLGLKPFKCAADDGEKSCPDGYTRKVINEKCVCMEEGAENVSQPDASTSDGVRVLSKDAAIYLDGVPVLSYTSCDDEGTEPNNTREKATQLTSQGYIPGWQICPAGDVDQFKIELEEQEQLTVEVLFKHEKGDLDAVLLDPDGFPVDSARSETDNEILKLSVAEKSGTYLIGVIGYGEAQGTFALRITR